MFFEGKMRGLFTMLFGAGVILFTSRAERRGSTEIADIYMRRNLLLMIFGVLHACFIWIVDILFDYGFIALLFLYPASTRHLMPGGQESGWVADEQAGIDSLSFNGPVQLTANGNTICSLVSLDIREAGTTPVWTGVWEREYDCN
jgi:hypothetical protein